MFEVGWWGCKSLRDLSRNVLRQGWVKAKVVGGWGGGGRQSSNSDHD